MSKLNRRTVAASVVLVLLASCGGGGGETPPTGGGTTTGGTTTGGTVGGGTVGGGGGTTIGGVVVDDGNGTAIGSDSNCKSFVKKGFTQDPSALSWNVGSGGAGIGVGSGGADGLGGIGSAGQLGKFVNATVVARKIDGSNEEIGQDRTDNAGMVTINTCGYTGPLEIAFKGNADAYYIQERLDTEDPTQREIVAFPAGKQLRAVVPEISANIGVSPFTDAASNYLDRTVLATKRAQTKSLSVKAIADSVREANARIADIVADQLPESYRPDSARGNGRFGLTQLPIPVDEVNGTRPGTLDNNAPGIATAVSAGFAVATDTFLPRSGATAAAAIVATEQLSNDLSDGLLDGVLGGAAVASTESPAYTYETLWRAKTIGTGRTAIAAGTAALAQTSAVGEIEISRFSASGYIVYASITGAGAQQFQVLRRTNFSQTVSLDSGGVLKLAREMSAQAGDTRNFVIDSSPERDLSQLTGRRFTDVRIGSQGEVFALTQDRRALLYVDPVEPYQVTGTEAAGQVESAIQAANTRLDFRLIPIGSDNLRVTSFTVAPAARLSATGSSAVPVALVVTSDGALRGLYTSASWFDGNGRRRPFDSRWASSQLIELSSPARLQAIVYDKGLAPAHDARYGAAPSTAALPWGGVRRLFGLQRDGKVRVWYEGRDAQGVQLDIPGVVIQLNADSKTGIYALTSAGRVFWLNADQAWVASEGELIRTDSSPGARRYALNAVLELAVPKGTAICWIGAEQAIDCASGKAYSWQERNAVLDFPATGSAGLVTATNERGQTPVPVGVGDLQEVDNADRDGALWRLSAVEHFAFNTTGPSPRLFRLDGLQYVSRTGRTSDRMLPGGKRNLGDDLVCDLTTLSKNCALDQRFPYIKGWQFRAALEAVRDRLGSSAITRQSNFPEGYRFDITGGPSGTDVIWRLTRSLVGGAPLPSSRYVQFRYRLQRNGTATTITSQSLERGLADGGSFVDPLSSRRAIRNTRPTDGNDYYPGARYQTDNGGIKFDDNDNLPLGKTIYISQSAPAQITAHRNASNFPLPDSQSEFLRHHYYAFLIPSLSAANPTHFKLCWEIATEGPDTKEGRLICSSHDQDGTYIGLSLEEGIQYLNPAINAGPRIDYGEANPGVGPQ